MRFLRLLISTLAAILAFACTTFAADWALTVDTPLSYTFNKKAIADPIPPNNGQAVFTDTTTGNVIGSKVMLIAPFHIGVGYEDYSVRQKVNIPVCACPAQGEVRLGIRMIDVMVDIPTRVFNFGLGYGFGTADVDIGLPSAIGINVNPVRHANAEQTFAVLGLALGQRLDVHLAYHLVSIQGVTFRDSSGTQSKLTASGSMLSGGLRLNF